MIDVRQVIFPMTAGDLVESAILVGHGRNDEGDALELAFLEVVGVATDEADDDVVRLHVRDQITGEEGDLELQRDTEILITGIARS